MVALYEVAWLVATTTRNKLVSYQGLIDMGPDMRPDVRGWMALEALYLCEQQQQQQPVCLFAKCPDTNGQDNGQAAGSSTK
jgi:hypothetical protein